MPNKSTACITRSEKLSPETAELIKKINRSAKEILSSKEKSRAFLVKAGICTEKGNLRKVYR
jgi:hypothetical protein